MKYLNKEQLKEITDRCFLCKNPRCTAHCPISTPIPEAIKLFREDKIEEAGELLFKNNPLSAVCGIVCPHEKTCYGNCIRAIKEDGVKFYELEKFISKKYLESLKLKKNESLDSNIAIIGSGPAGIALSLILAEKGHKVTIFEVHEKIGGVLRYGIPEFRLPRNILDELENRLTELNVKIRYNTLVGPVITLDKLLEDGYDAVFIGTGVWNPKPLNIKGETLGNVHYAIDYLKEPRSFKLGNKVLVIGAGNVAMDAARTAKYYGSEDVRIVYRKDFKHMPAINEEISEAKEEGVEFELFKAPLEIKEEGLLVVTTKLDINEEGKEVWTNVEDSEELLTADNVIIAVSQGPRRNIVANTDNLQVNKWGNILTDENGRTTRNGVFASGDVVTGAKTVVEAVADAKKVAESIHTYCLNKKK